MQFNSYGFIFMILPITLIGFYLIRFAGTRLWGEGARTLALLKGWLLLASFVFMCTFGWQNVLCLMGSIVWNTIFLKLCGGKKSRPLFLLGIAGNIVFLGFFKYSGWFFPLAISFYIFEQISVVTDTYRGTVGHHGEPAYPMTPLNYLLFLLYFPKLLQGPIARYDKMAMQFDRLAKKRFDADEFLRGCLLFAMGLGKKVLLADVLTVGIDAGYTLAGELTTLDVIVLMVGYIFQLYFDFSGYCDMGEGISMMLGLRLPVNFHSPYKSENMLVFWDRWHATLQDFLTDYVYIPLGGSRKGKARMLLNMLIVFVLSGIWHGNTLSFLVWGLYNGLLAMLFKVLPLPQLGKSLVDRIRHVLRVALTVILWSISQTFFRADSLQTALTVLGRFGSTKIHPFFVHTEIFGSLFGLELKTLMTHSPLYNTPWFTVVGGWSMLLLCSVLVFCCRNSTEIALEKNLKTRTVVLCALLFVWSCTSLSGVSKFLYMNF